MSGTRLTGHLRSVRGFYGSFTDRKSDLQTVIVTYKQVKEPLKAQLGEQFEGSSYYTRYIFPLYFYSLFATREQDSRPVSSTIWEEFPYTLVYISFYVFTVLLKCLRRLYAYGSIFKYCQYIITALINNHCAYWRTNPLITKHWLIRGTPVSVYIDHVTYFNRITTVTNLIRAYNTIRIPCPETRLFRVPFKWYKQ